MKKQIQKALDVLIGKPLWAATRAADLASLQFGQRRTIQDMRGNSREVGEYALHVQCAWRIRQGNRVVVASRDLYYPPEETEEPPLDFNWDMPGANRRDKRIAELFQNETRQFQVHQVKSADAGSFTLSLENEYSFEVFPDDSMHDEHWRLFKPYTEEPHFVVTGKILEESS
jgi:hypothetical protein